MTQNNQDVKTKIEKPRKNRRYFRRDTRQFLGTKRQDTLRHHVNGYITIPNIVFHIKLDGITRSLFFSMLAEASYMTDSYGQIPGSLNDWSVREDRTREQIKTALYKLIDMGLIHEKGTRTQVKRYITNYHLYHLEAFDQDKINQFFLPLTQTNCEIDTNKKCGKHASIDTLSDSVFETDTKELQNRHKKIEQTGSNSASNETELTSLELINIKNITCKHEAYKYEDELQELANNEFQHEHFVVDEIDIVNVILLQARRLAQHALNRSDYHVTPDEFMTLLLSFEDSINCNERDISKCKTGQDYVNKFRGVLVPYARAQNDKQYPAYATEQVRRLT